MIPSEANRISSDVMPVTTEGLAGYGLREETISRKRRPRGRPPGPRRHPVELVDSTPAYSTPLGAAYVGDAAALLKSLPDHSVNAIITSPPYALHFKKKYGNPNQADYVD